MLGERTVTLAARFLDMLSPQLVDLDELILTVRDSRSRAYVAEAVAAYRAGARRTALIGAWIAVAFDLIAKLCELAVGGDAAARAFVVDLDSAIAAGEKRRLQIIEQSLLQTACNPFALLAPHESEALKRLQADRHLCAHPAFLDEDHLFEPTAEAVRAHIVQAIIFLLQHQPVQGRHAIEHILQELGRQSFPSTLDGATRYLEDRYLSRAKPSLVSNLTKRLLLASLRRDVADLAGREQAIEHALAAVNRVHPQQYRESVRGALDQIVGALEDSQLANLCRLLAADPQIWGWLSEPLRLRTRQFLTSYQFLDEHHTDVLRAAAVDELRAPLMIAFERLQDDRKVVVIAASPISMFVTSALRLFGAASGFRYAERLAEQIIVPLAPSMAAKQIAILLGHARSNPQIWDASRMPVLLAEVLEAAPPPVGPAAEAWRTFMMSMTEHALRYQGHYDPYTSLRETLAMQGVDVPATTTSSDESRN